jgi:hypothetical protein
MAKTMSYNVAIVVPPVALDDPTAWSELDGLIDAAGTVPPVFETLLERLTSRYPCICDLDDERVDDGVWSDGPLAGNLGCRASVLGIVHSRVDDVLPFLVAESLRLGLVVFDWGTGTVHRAP